MAVLCRAEPPGFGSRKYGARPDGSTRIGPHDVGRRRRARRECCITPMWATARPATPAAAPFRGTEVLTNPPENLARWIEAPQEVDSLTAMPDVGVGPAEARDIATWLYPRP